MGKLPNGLIAHMFLLHVKYMEKLFINFKRFPFESDKQFRKDINEINDRHKYLSENITMKN